MYDTFDFEFSFMRLFHPLHFHSTSSSLVSKGFDEDGYEYIYLYYQCDYCLFYLNSILKRKTTVSYLNRLDNYLCLYFICRSTIQIIEKGYLSRELFVIFP